MPRKRSAIGVRTPAARRMAARAARGQSSRTLENPQQSQARLQEATILTGCFQNEEVFISRIPLIHDDKHSPLHFKRLQFPIRVSFAMSINKAQGQSLKIAGIDLEQPCFSHGQLRYDGLRRGGGELKRDRRRENGGDNRYGKWAPGVWPYGLTGKTVTRRISLVTDNEGKLLLDQRQRTYRPKDKTICWDCGKPGHIRANCKEANISRPYRARLDKRCDDVPGKIIIVSRLQRGSNELATEGLVNGVPCRMVIDSGTNVTLLRVDLAQRMGSISKRIPVSNELVLQTATGEQAKFHGTVVLKFQIGNNLFSHLGYLADIKDDCLIGLDVLRKLWIQHRLPKECTQDCGRRDSLSGYMESECILEVRLTTSHGVPQLLNMEENGQGIGQKELRLARTLLNWIQKKKPKRLLCQYEDVFATSPNDVGRTNVTQHRIDKAGATPVKQLPRRLPMTIRDEVDKLIEDIAEQDVVEPLSSPWASTVVLVKKKDGSIRFCMDYRHLSDLTKKNSYPLPLIDATFDTLSGSQWFSTLDLKSGYWKINIHPED
ncbi:K02A2.6-like [Cordylochernes scorpioides]|uniref:K02A2.6-like n=1 Tax=Cordylochernes scorpioides TaxID=51811 RepID=A0ABY6LAA4_9ARAC|nr:K02A2.6-like [Cordylochernes scorpioides]